MDSPSVFFDKPLQFPGLPEPTLQTDFPNPYDQVVAVANDPAPLPPLLQPVDSFEQAIAKFRDASPSFQSRTAPTFFDWDRSQAERYIQSDYYKELGFDPEGDNESRYGYRQTTGNVVANAFAGAGKLAWNTFKDGWLGWKRLVDALVSLDSSKLMGSPAEIEALNREQQAIFNKYAIYRTPESENSIFNRQFIGDLIQQSGFTVGALGQFLSEELLTMGIAGFFKPLTGARTIAQMSRSGLTAGELARDLNRASNIWTSHSTVQKLYNGMKTMAGHLPVAGGLVDTAKDMANSLRQGARGWDVAGVTLNGLRRTIAEANMAITESRMEAAATYGELKDQLYAETLAQKGSVGVQDVQEMERVAQQAAKANFQANALIIAAMNRIQLDNIFTSFGSGKRMMQQLSNEGHPVRKVTGKTVRDLTDETGNIITPKGTRITRAYDKEPWGIWRQIPEIAADFGGRKAAIETAKAVGRHGLKLEVSEGLQELLQESSNTAVQQYFTSRFHQQPADAYTTFMAALSEQFTRDGFKTFLMGALTGKLISPLHFGLQQLTQRFIPKDQRNQNRLSRQEALKLVNAFMANPAHYIPEWMANTQVQNQAAQNMQEALDENSKYHYNNAKDTAFAQAVLSAEKLNMLPTLVDVIRDLGKHLDEHQFQEAFGIDFSSDNRNNVQQYTNKVADQIEGFAKRRRELREKFAAIIDPLQYSEQDRPKVLLVQRAVEDTLDWVAANEYHAGQAGKRWMEIMAEAAKIPGIEQTAFESFQVLADDQELERELKQLADTLQTEKQNTAPTKELKSRIKQLESRIKALETFVANRDVVSNHAKKKQAARKRALGALHQYLLLLNQDKGLSASIAEQDLENLFQLLTDSRDLHARHREFLNTLNFLSSPKGFLSLFSHRLNELEEVRLGLIKQLQELIQQSEQPTSAPTPTPPPPSSTTTTPVPAAPPPSITTTTPPAPGTPADEDSAPTPPASDTGSSPAVPEPVPATLTSEVYEFTPDQEYMNPAHGIQPVTYRVRLQKDSTGTIHDIEYFVLGNNTKVHPLKGIHDEDQVKLFLSITTQLAYFNRLASGALKQEIKTQQSDVPGKKGVKRVTIHQTILAIINPAGREQMLLDLDDDVFAELSADISFEPGDTDEQKENYQNVLEVITAHLVAPLRDMQQRLLQQGSSQMAAGPARFKLDSKQPTKVFTIAGKTQADLAQLLHALPKEKLVSGLSLRVTRIPPGTTRTLLTVGKNEVITRPSPLNLELLFEGKTVGFLSHPDALGTRINGTEKGLGELTAAEFNSLFESNAAFAEIQAAYNSAVTLITTIETALGKKDTLELSSQELSRLAFFTTSPGEYDFTTDYRPLQHLVDNGNEILAIIDKRIPGQPLLMAKGLQQTQDKIEETVRLMKDMNFDHATRHQGRYIAIVRMPNQQVRFIEVVSAPLSADEQDSLFVAIKDQTEKTLAENVQPGEKGKKMAADVSFNSLFNDNILSGQFFIAYPPEHKGLYTTFEITATGDLQVTIFDQRTNTPVRHQMYVNNLVNNKGTFRFRSMKDLLAQINLAITNYNTRQNIALPVLQSSYFKKSISRTAAYKELLNQVTNVSLRITKNANLYVFANQQTVPPVQPIIAEPQVQPQKKKKRLSDVDMKKLKEGEEYIPEEKNQKPAPVNQLAQLKTQEEAEKAALRKKYTDKKGTITNTEAYTRELKAINDKYSKQKAALVNSQKNKGIALKISEGFDEQAVSDIAEFTEWMKRLPSFLTVEQIDTLQSRLSAGNILLGRFRMLVENLADGKSQTTGGIIETDATYPYKYHEAFHAVFRLLLPDNRIQQLLSVARYQVTRSLQSKGSTLQEALIQFRSLHPLYQSLTQQELEDTYLEEWMADQFEHWKKQPGSDTDAENSIIRFFKNLWYLIKKLLSARYSLPHLFRQIDAGKFRNSQIVDNRYTRHVDNLGSLEALKIDYDVDYITDGQGNVVEVKKYLSESDTNRLVGGVVNTFLRRTEGLSHYNKNEILQQIIDDYQRMYLSREYRNLTPEKLDRLEIFRKVFSEPDPREALIKSADVYLTMLGYLQDLDSDEYDAIVDDMGDRNSTENWNETHGIGGFKSLSSYVRRYIQSIALEGEDEFGNKYLDEATGEQLLVGVNAGIIYNGLLKVCAGVTTAEKFLKRLEVFSHENPESRAFVQKFMEDTGVLIDEETGLYTAEKDPRLFNAVFKSFTLFQVDYLTLRIHPGVGIDVRQANRRDAAANQYNRWQNAFIFHYQDIVHQKPALKEQLLAALRSLYIPFQSEEPVSDQELFEYSSTHLATLQQITGIKIAGAYYRYSVLTHLKEQKATLTPQQQDLLDSFEEIEPITGEDLLEITRTIDAGENPFINFEQELFTEEEKDEEEQGESPSITTGRGNETRLRKMAGNNAVFDETVLATSWVNAEGKTVWSHQLPTFHLTFLEEHLRDEQKLRSLVESDAFLKNSYIGQQILQSPSSSRFLATLRSIMLKRIDGMRQITAESTSDGRIVENQRLDYNQKEGVTYGQFGDREMILALIGLYMEPEQVVTNLVDELDPSIKIRKTTTTRHLIRILEASNTADTLNMPVINAITVSGNQLHLSDTARHILLTELENEYDRIRRVARAIEADKTGLVPIDEVIADYNDYTVPTSKMRGLRFWNFTSLLGPLATQLEARAQATFDLPLSEKLKASALAAIEQSLLGAEGMVDQYIEKMVGAGIVSRDLKTGKLKNEMLPPFFWGRKKKVPARLEGLHLRNDFRSNVAQFFVNDLINTTLINELVLGDQAKGLKDFIDAVKRAKGANASGYNLRSDILAPQLGIHETFNRSFIHVHKDEEYPGQYSGQMQKRTDAQLWATTKAQRYIDFALGRLTSKEAAFLDKIELGLPLQPEEIYGDEGSIANNYQVSVKKIVYYNRDTYVKTSMFVLTKRFTSYLKPAIQQQVDVLLQQSENKITDQIRALCENNTNWLPLPGMEVLHNKRVMLEEWENANKRVAFSAPESAIKTMRVNVGKDLVNFSDGQFLELQNDYWRLQTENPSNKVTITDPTQARHIIDSEQQDSTPVIYRGVATTVGELKILYQRDSARRIFLKYKDARDMIFSIEELEEELDASIDTGKVTVKLAAFQKRALETLQRTGASSQLLELFEVKENPDTGDAEPRYDLNHPLTLNKYVQLFLAYFRNDVMSEKVPGHSLTLVSDFGVKVLRRVKRVDKNGNVIESEVIPRETFLKNPESWPPIKDLQKDPLKPGDLYTGELQHNVPEYDDQGQIIGYYSEMLMPAHFREMMEAGMEGIPESLRKSFGVRIPSQDKHSFITIRWVDMLPAELGSSGIFPKELLEISGADFDVDKLYMQIADFFVRQLQTENGKQQQLVRYGDEADTPAARFEQYVLWNTRNNQRLKDVLNTMMSADKVVKQWEAELSKLSAQRLVLNRQFQTGKSQSLQQLQLRKTVNESIDKIRKNLAAKKEKLKWVAMKEVGMPVNEHEYEQKLKTEGELNIGVLNNRILDYKIQFQTNKYQQTKGIPFEVANIRPLEEVERDARIVPGVIVENNVAIDNPLGKLLAFINNQEGKSNIAPAVNAMLAFTFVNKYQIDLLYKPDADNRLQLNGHTFTGYRQTRSASFDAEGRFQGYTGPRIFNIISSIISAMTDNAKERKAAKLNLNIDAVGVAANLVALGVPKEETIAILLSPAIKEYYKRIRSFGYAVQVGNRQPLRMILSNLIAEYQTRAGGENVQPKPLTSRMLFDNLKEENPLASYSTLVYFAGILDQTNYFMDVAQILKLSKGLGTELQEWDDNIKMRAQRLGLFATDKDFQKMNVPFDLRDAVWKEHQMTATYLKIALQLENLSKTMILPRATLFGAVRTAILNNLQVPLYLKQRYEHNLTNHLILFFALKAYLRQLQDRGDELAPLLDNRLIYGTDKEFRSITDIFREARQMAPDNHLLRFLFANPITVMQGGKEILNPNNKTGVHTLQANTWAKLDNYQLDKLQNAFIDLYSNEETRSAALALFAYLVVKDATLFRSDSFIQVIPTFMFSELLGDIMVNVRNIFKRNNLVTHLARNPEYMARFREVFGNDFTGLVEEFYKVFIPHVSNNFYIPKISMAVDKTATETVRAIRYGVTDGKIDRDVITVDMFEGVRQKMLIQVASEDGITWKEAIRKNKQLNEKEFERFIQNRTQLRKKGFILEKKDNKWFIRLPYLIKVRSYQGGYDYYRLENLHTLTAANKESGPLPLRDLLSSEDFLIRAPKATYRKTQLTGASAHTPLAGIFGTVPSTKLRRRKAFGYSADQLSSAAKSNPVDAGNTLEEKAVLAGMMSMEEYNKLQQQDTTQQGPFVSDDPDSFAGYTPAFFEGEQVNEPADIEQPQDQTSPELTVKELLETKGWRMQVENGLMKYWKDGQPVAFAGTPGELLDLVEKGLPIPSPAKPARKRLSGINMQQLKESEEYIPENDQKNPLNNDCNK